MELSAPRDECIDDMQLRYDVSLALGAVIALASIGGTRRYYAKHEQRAWAGGLVCAALIYVGFALRWGTWTWVGIEVCGVVLYGLLARAGGRWLVAGWLLHPIWDLALHLYGPGRAIVPKWYAMSCCAYDVMAAVYLHTSGVL